jgi:poly(3-hydroxyoctanoate) depolymerase
VTADASLRERTIGWLGGEFFVRERGDGFPLLLINGLGANLEMWGPSEEHLSGVARTILFDAPGTGRSSTPPWPPTIPAVARLAAALVDELGYERVDVLGFSLGGLVAQQLAHDEPGLVRRLALVGTACGWGSLPGSPRALALIAMPLRYYSRWLSDQTNRLLSPVDHELVRRLPALTEARLRHPPTLYGYLAQLWSGSLWSSLWWLPSVRVTTLVVHGELDELVPAANGVQLARLLPESRLHVLPGEGHCVVFDPASGSHALLAEFFASETLEDSATWSLGQAIDADSAVEAAFDAWDGTRPYRAFSDAFRWFFESNGNGSYPAA